MRDVYMQAVRGGDWSNLAASVAAGALAASRESCATERLNPHLVDLRIAYSFALDRELGRIYTFNAHRYALYLWYWLVSKCSFFFVCSRTSVRLAELTRVEL